MQLTLGLLLGTKWYKAQKWKIGLLWTARLQLLVPGLGRKERSLDWLHQTELEGMEQLEPSAGVERDQGTTPKKILSIAFCELKMIYWVTLNSVLKLMHIFLPAPSPPYTDVYMWILFSRLIKWILSRCFGKKKNSIYKVQYDLLRKKYQKCPIHLPYFLEVFSLYIIFCSDYTVQVCFFCLKN